MRVRYTGNFTPAIVKFFQPSTCPNFTTLDDIKFNLPDSDRTKSLYYYSINPRLQTHDIYLGKHSVPEYQRLVFTRLRLASHKLKIETGRWNVPPIPVADRFCTCGRVVQDEKHIIESCRISQPIRIQYPNILFSIQNILNTLDKQEACLLCYKIYSLYDL